MTPEKSIEEIIEKEANEYAEKIAFRIPYDGSNDFYDTKVFEDCNTAYIAGRSKSIESEKAKDERIKKLKEELGKSIEIIKQWHNADEVWDIYFNNAPEMKSIRELLNNK